MTAKYRENSIFTRTELVPPDQDHLRLSLGRRMHSAAQACSRTGLPPVTCKTGCSSGAADSKALTREMVELQVRCYTVSSRSSDVDVQVSTGAGSPVTAARRTWGNPTLVVETQCVVSGTVPQDDCARPEVGGGDWNQGTVRVATLRG